jgi:predicted Ser/Thr protein kinase
VREELLVDLPPGVREQDLRQWLEQTSGTGEKMLGHGYQAPVYLYDRSEPPLVVKSCRGSGVSRRIRRMMLVREWRAYQRLDDVPGIPRGFGLLDGEHLVMEYIRGVPFRQARIQDRERFFERLVALVDALHTRGVAHCDLKKKENVIVLEGERPCFIDFGAAICLKPGFAPLNRQLFRIGQILDQNACLKLYYGKPLSQLDREQLARFQRTRIERVTRWVRDRRVHFREYRESLKKRTSEHRKREER